MTTFRNTKFTKREYHCTNVVFCIAEKAPNENWIECAPDEITLMGCVPLHIGDGVAYYGWL